MQNEDTQNRPLVIVESPYKSNEVTNSEYLALCIDDCLKRGEAPFASHGFYTKYLDDNNADDRRLGMSCGFEWMKACSYVVVYTDLGISSGMDIGIVKARELEKNVFYRHLAPAKFNKWWSAIHE